MLTVAGALPGSAILAQDATEASRRCVAEEPGDRALAQCRDATRLAPGDLAARRALAAAYAARGDHASALEELREVARRDPHSAHAQLDVASALDRLGRRDEALRAYRRYLELDPDEPRAHELVGWLLLQHGRPSEALAEFSSARRLAPQRGAAHHGYGVALASLGRREEALRALQAAGRLSPGDASIWGEMAATAADLGKTADALSAWEHALAIEPSYFDRRPEERRRWESLAAKSHARASSPARTPAPIAAAGRETPREAAPAPPRRGAVTGFAVDASGSGFAVTSEGHIVTNRHVVNGCRSLGVRADSGAARPARLIAVHPRDDVAVIQTGWAFEEVATFRDGTAIRPGENVVAIGFPLAGLLADEPNVTTGSVSALAGIHNDRSVLQMSAPVQQGSSGGPLLDASGNVVGVVVTKLNARIVAEETGDLPQNVNFALKAEIARSFLDQLGIRYQAAASSATLSNADVGAIGRRVTVLVECAR